MSFEVILPNPRNPDGPWVTVDTFDTEQEAMEYIQDLFGADEEGKISIVQELESEEEIELDDEDLVGGDDMWDSEDIDFDPNSEDSR